MDNESPAGSSEQTERILDVAAELIAASGFHGASMRHIAARMNLNQGSLYLYVGSKAELLERIVNDVDLRLSAGMNRIVASNDDPLTKLKAIAANELGVHVDRPHWCRVHAREYRHLGSEALGTAIQKREARDEQIQAILREGTRRGQLRDLEPVKIASAAFVENLHLVYERLGSLGGISFTEFAGSYTDTLVGGWGAAPAWRSGNARAPKDHEVKAANDSVRR